MARDDQPSSPWRADTDDDALTASGYWPTSTDAAHGRRGLSQIKRTLQAANPPTPKPQARRHAQEMRRTG